MVLCPSCNQTHYETIAEVRGVLFRVSMHLEDQCNFAPRRYKKRHMYSFLLRADLDAMFASNYAVTKNDTC